MTAENCSVAVAIFCKTPAAGQSKTRLSPPLTGEQCSLLSACFITDMAAIIDEVTARSGDIGYAVYTPKGSETALRQLLPVRLRLLLQCDCDFGARLQRALADMLALGHRAAILVNSDSPTLPASILLDAVNALKAGAEVVLSPALDGGYTLIGVSTPNARLFEDIPWSTADVYGHTLLRASEAGLSVTELTSWYDVDDASSLSILEAEMAGVRPSFADPSLQGSPAPVTRALLAQLRSTARAQAALP